MRLVFMGTPQFAVPHLHALASGDHTIIGVVTRPDRPAGRGRRLAPPPVKEAASELRLPIWQPATLNDAEFRHVIDRLKPDVICVVAYGGFLPKWLLDVPPKQCVNVHPSLLPKYRGAAPIQRAIMNGDQETGVSTMYMVEAMDAGDVILQDTVPIAPNDDAGAMHDQLARVGARLLGQTVDLIAQGAAPRKPQDASMVTFAPKIEPADEVINWKNSARHIDAQIRGLRPRPGAYTWYQGRRLKVSHARELDSEAPRAVSPGTVVSIDDQTIVVATGSGMLGLVEVQPENAKRMRANEFANGYRVTPGDCLVQ